VTCPRCGRWAAPPSAINPVGPAHATAVCPHCGGERPFVYLPLFVLTGANGTGKSTLCPPLRRLLPECVVFEADAVPLTWSLAEWSERKAEYRTACLSVALEIAQSGRPVVLVGTVTPAELETNELRPYFRDVHYFALICDEALIEQRLRARPGSHTTLARNLDEYINTQLWVNREYQDEASGTPPMTLVAASTATPNQLAEQTASWVRALLASVAAN
jgi:predicted kinase